MALIQHILILFLNLLLYTFQKLLGDPIYKKNEYNRNIIDIRKNSIVMIGQGGSPEGYRPFLSVLDLKSVSSTILFRSQAPYYERPIKLSSDNENERKSKSRKRNGVDGLYFVEDC